MKKKILITVSSSSSSRIANRDNTFAPQEEVFLTFKFKLSFFPSIFPKQAKAFCPVVSFVNYYANKRNIKMLTNKTGNPKIRNSFYTLEIHLCNDTFFGLDLI
ncbi:hypothetical protein EGR_07277 [Echinococcus granulosus]|uniref:Uncharacterized protein n=1 Tax=Echinococcus granulosus TaxID=6210 RepID=W6UA46_ECHGR|nr:hypothetical protein EGR_07277 [Echinococcus granulosus]EUB57915.1 hypothetical protein EGR_07277 [Echinococcus granulosus]